MPQDKPTPLRVTSRAALLDEQTTIRRTLAENGYSPLPAREKVVTMKGWPTLEADEVTIENWKLSAAFCTTALRIEGNLLAVDVDIDDPATDDLCDLLEAAVPALRVAPLRWGKGDKRMYLLRCEEQPKIIASHVFMRGGSEDDRHRLEVFGGGTTRYFTCFGPHTEGETTAEGVEILIEYQWEAGGGSPLSLRPEQLPAITVGEVLSLVDIANEWMEGRGWERSLRSVSGKISDEPVFDLSDDMIFECSDGADRTLADLRELRRVSNLRCSASWHEAGATNRSRCIIDKHHDGSPKVFDFDEYRWHLPENADRRSLGEKSREETAEAARGLGTALTGMGYGALVGEAFDSWFEEAVAGLVKNWGWMPGGGNGYAVYLPDDSRDKMSLPSFKEAFASLGFFAEAGPRGGKPKRYTATAIWSLAEDRVNIAGYRYKPGLPERVIEEDGQVWVNNYVPPITAEKALGLATWLSFLEHLIPDETERDWFHNWLAWKIQTPADRGAAIVFVSEGVQGTGRGTLFNILTGVFGRKNVVGVPYGMLVGTHGQSQFDEWRLDKVLVYCNEASSSEGSYSASTKRKQYDALKDVIDPAAGTVTVNVKMEKARTDKTYVSLMIASNYADALPLEYEDRRFAILTTPTKLEPQGTLARDLFAMIHQGAPSPEFVTDIRRHYLRMSPVRDDFMAALHTEAKEEMAELSEGPVERIARAAVHTVGEPDFLSSSALCARVDVALQQRNLAKLSGYTRNGVAAVLASMGYSKVARMRAGGERHIIYGKRGVNPALLDEMSPEEREALLKV